MTVHLSRRQVLAGAGTALGASLLRMSAFAENYPARPITYVVAYPPGGTSDTVARAVASQMSKILGQPFIVENRPGGGGALGTHSVATAKPDGYTLLHTSVSFLIVAPQLVKVPYDPFKSIDPIGFFGTNTNPLAVRPTLPVNSIDEFIAYAKKNPGKLTYGSSGAGTGSHITTEYFKLYHGLDFVHVPYKGAAQSILDMVAGRLDFTFDPMVVPHAQAGKLKAIAVPEGVRVPSMPDLPSMSEKRWPNWTPPEWYNFVSAPAGTPADIKAKINDAASKAVDHPDVKKVMTLANFVPGKSTTDALVARIHRDYETIAKVIKDAHIKVE